MQVTGILRKSMAISTAVRVCGLMRASFGQAAESAINLLRASVFERRGTAVIRAELNSFNARQTLAVGEKSYTYFSLEAAAKKDLACIASLPFALKVLLENLLRHEDGRTVTKADIEALARWSEDRGKAGKEIAFRPARVLMQDFTGVPAVVDLATSRPLLDGARIAARPAKRSPFGRPESSCKISPACRLWSIWRQCVTLCVFLVVIQARSTL